MAPTEESSSLGGVEDMVQDLWAYRGTQRISRSKFHSSRVRKNLQLSNCRDGRPALKKQCGAEEDPSVLAIEAGREMWMEFVQFLLLISREKPM